MQHRQIINYMILAMAIMLSLFTFAHQRLVNSHSAPHRDTIISTTLLPAQAENVPVTIYRMTKTGQSSSTSIDFEGRTTPELAPWRSLKAHQWSKSYCSASAQNTIHIEVMDKRKRQFNFKFYLNKESTVLYNEYLGACTSLDASEGHALLRIFNHH